MRTPGITLVLAIFALALSPRASLAVSVTWTYTGTVGSFFDAGGQLAGFVAPNDPFTAVIGFDSGAPDTDPGPDGVYDADSFLLQVGSLTFEDPSASIKVQNDVPFDGVIIDAFPALTAGGNPTLAGLSWQAKLELIDPPPAPTLTDTSLPIVPPDPAVFNAGASFLVGGAGAINLGLDLEDASFEVPEPGSAALLATALIVLGARGRRRIR